MTKARLEIWDLDRDRSSLLLETAQHIEAPNWMPDGQNLLLNANGQLYRVPLAEPALIPVATGGLAQLNNDHAPSPDGRWIAFCDKTETGSSAVYVMPAQGGAARLLTPIQPSWLHGWMPDSSAVVYAAVRDGQFAIARSDLDGVETVLITGPGHYDGPDVSTDGRWIWFNSNRSGPMALWRMRPDGSDPQQMSDGAKDHWFPHPAPDGRQLCFLAYDKDTAGHPFGVTVDLCLMPAKGGRARVLDQIFGGQGCLNTPCWAPDGRRFAYVRYLQNSDERS